MKHFAMCFDVCQLNATVPVLLMNVILCSTENLKYDCNVINFVKDAGKYYLKCYTLEYAAEFCLTCIC